jgi:hypothetical protein
MRLISSVGRALRVALPFLVVSGLVAGTLASARAADLSGDYTWNSVMVGGGGWGALVFESPAAPGVVYFKDDCSSIYRLDGGATVWKKLNTWGSLPTGYTVQGITSGSSHPGGANIACAANDPNRAYMSWDRNLFYSNDKGDSWKTGTISPPLNYMNEVDNPQPQRGCDALRRLQRLVVDPNNKDVAYYGSSFDGLYRTTDGGVTWSHLANGLYAGGKVDGSANTGGFINTAFDKTGGTVDGRTKIVWATCRTQGVYRSTDGGDSFSLVTPQTQPIYYTSAACDAAGTFFVAAGSNTDNDGKIYKCARGDSTLAEITPYATGVWQTIDIHPSDQKLWAQTEWFGHAFSADGGATWTAQPGGTWVTGTKDVPWHSATNGTTGMVRFSPNTPNKLWIAYGNGGVGYCTDPWAAGNLTMNKLGQGIEDLCLSKITATNTGRLHLSAWEEAGFSWDTDALSTPPAESWKVLAGITDGWGLKEGECNAVCETAQDNVVATVVHYENGDSRNIRSTDGGKTWSPLVQRLPIQWCGNVAVSRNDPNRFLIGQCTYDVHWYGHLGMSTDRYLKLTTDGGKSFADSAGSGTIHMWGGAIYGSNAMNLCADPNVDGRFVAFSNYDFYIHASADGGASFKPINTARPFAVENGVWAKIFGIPGQSGHFYFCQGAGPVTNAPLWKSTDGGVTWANTNPGLTKVIMAGWGKAMSGATYPTLYVYGTYRGVKGFFRSSDAGASWDQIAGQYLPNNYIFDNVKDIEGDKITVGKVYVIIGGTSLVYGVYGQ